MFDIVRLLDHPVDDTPVVLGMVVEESHLEPRLFAFGVESKGKPPILLFDFEPSFLKMVNEVFEPNLPIMEAVSRLIIQIVPIFPMVKVFF